MTHLPSSTASVSPPSGTVELAPSYRLPLAVVLLSVPIAFIQIAVGLAIAAFGVFLWIQAATLRLEFTNTDLDIYRGETRIRQFSYQDWLHWELFWPRVPILFYFREVKNIHFLPILFDPKMLKMCLEQRCPRLQK